VRFKLRTGMVGLAIVATVVWGVETSRRSSAYHRRARQHWNAMESDEGRELVCMGPFYEFCRLNNSVANCDFSVSLHEEFAGCIRWQSASMAPGYLKPLDPDKPAREEYHHRMYHKWMRAAARPWLSVVPDEAPK
jgi:hypothetical protein